MSSVNTQTSASTRFGSRRQTKQALAAELGALLAFSAITNNDKVGLVMFTDRIELALRPRKGNRHVLRVIREILSSKPRHLRTNLNVALKTLNDVITKRSTVFLFSDFLDEGYEKLLKIAYKKHDIVAVVVEDPTEKKFPPVSGTMEFEDAETGEGFTLHAQRSFRERFEEAAMIRKQKREKIFSSVGLDSITLETGRPYIDSLIHFFKTRARRFR